VNFDMKRFYETSPTNSLPFALRGVTVARLDKAVRVGEFSRAFYFRGHHDGGEH